MKKETKVSRIRQTLQDYILITLGSLCMAAAIDVFLVPNNVISLGFTGLGMIANHLWQWPVGVVTLGLNIPLLLAGIKWGGGFNFFFRTIYTVIVMTVAIDLLKPLLPAIHEGPLIYTLFGGILNGLGVGLILRGQGSAGGTDIIALLLNRHQSIPFGQVYLIANSTVLGLGALVMGLVPALYALIVVFASSLVVNMILEGVGYARAVFIITEQQEALREAIMLKINRGVTLIEGVGGFTQLPRTLLFVVVSPAQITQLKRVVTEVDANAFVVISDAREVFGRGFHPMTTG